MKWLIDLAKGVFYKEEIEKKATSSFSSWLNIKEIETELDEWRKKMREHVSNMNDFVLAETLAELDMEFSSDFSELFKSYYRKVLENRKKMEDLLLEKMFGSPDYIPSFLSKEEILKKKASINVHKKNDIWTIELRGEVPYVVRIIDEVDLVDQVNQFLENLCEKGIDSFALEKVISTASERFGLLPETIQKMVNELILDKKIAFSDDGKLIKIGSIQKFYYSTPIDKVVLEVFDPNKEIENRLFPLQKFMERKGKLLRLNLPYPKNFPINAHSLKRLRKIITRDFRGKSDDFLRIFLEAMNKIDSGESLDFLQEIQDEELRQELIEELIESGFLLDELSVIDSDGNDEQEGSPQGYSSMSGSGNFIEPYYKNKY
ncbi:MAG: hypothetical protein QXY70_00490 [Nanopusillaceae archaeon]